MVDKGHLICTNSEPMHTIGDGNKTTTVFSERGKTAADSIHNVLNIKKWKS